MAKLTVRQMLLALGMLVTGSINTLSKKAQNDCVVKGISLPTGPNGTMEATAHPFNHPWFQTVIMFIGETLCLIGLIVYRKRERSLYKKQILGNIQDSNDDYSQPITVEAPNQPRIFQFIFLIPTICDLFGTTLAGIGLVYVSASVWQMLRGSIIIFTGILSKIFLKRNLRLVHWSGIVITMMGLVLVGLSDIFENEEKKGASKQALGIALILAGQFVSATQMIIEELFLKKRGFHPLQVVGMEGLFGMFLLGAIVLPVLYYIPDESAYSGRYEDSLDALMQIYNSTKLLLFVLLYLSSIAFYNYFGLAVTKSLTAVHRTLIDACRTMLVWLTSLLIYYVFSKDFGEAFDKTWGIIQIDGFMFLMIGTAMYNELFDLEWIPCCRTPREEQNDFSRRTNDRDLQANSDEDADDTDTLLNKPPRNKVT
ncbi:solute carrier family 35 member F6-like [Ptychodera flava]|uniref:solute carrier family 35 member F6-like n=1 Tax=Ptychodera flava TaxID=63121 RepID=UPI00396A67E7